MYLAHSNRRRVRTSSRRRRTISAPPSARRGNAFRAIVMSNELVRFVEQLAADEHAADFAGAGADLVELGVAQQPPGRKVVDVTVAAEALDCLERHPGGAFGRVQNGAGGVLARGLAAIAGARHRIDVSLRRVERHIHVGELGLHELKLPDRLAELLALVQIRNDQVEAGLHDAERPRRQHRALVVSAGTSQSANTSSPVSEPRMPSLSSFWPVENPLKSFSMMKAVMPRAPAAGSVLA